MKTTLLCLLLLTCPLLFVACGGSEANSDTSAPASERTDGLTDAQLKNGIGPITEITLGPIDDALAAEGQASFTTKCSACHKMDTRYVGPPLANVLDLRTPEYVMNMMLNPDEMVKKHPEAKDMLAQYMTIMPNQNLQEPEARAILEYLRQVQATTSTN